MRQSYSLRNPIPYENGIRHLLIPRKESVADNKSRVDTLDCNLGILQGLSACGSLRLLLRQGGDSPGAHPIKQKESEKIKYCSGSSEPI